MSKIYYKVVVKYDGKYFSCLYNMKTDSYINTSNLIVEYKPNEWVKPNIKETSLMCFDSLYDAKHFVRECCSFGRIFTCKIKKPHKNYKLFNYSVRNYRFFEIFLELLKKKKLKKKINSDIDFIPNGTTFCKELMLLEEVKL